LMLPRWGEGEGWWLLWLRWGGGCTLGGQQCMGRCPDVLKAVLRGSFLVDEV
jgi:hypothetical protein